jgi:hypothetical protein
MFQLKEINQMEHVQLPGMASITTVCREDTASIWFWVCQSAAACKFVNSTSSAEDNHTLLSGSA